MRNAGLAEPEFASERFFHIIFRRNPEYALKSVKGTDVEKTVEKILNLIAVNPQITQKDLMFKTQLTRRGVEWNLKNLRDEKKIITKPYKENNSMIVTRQ